MTAKKLAGILLALISTAIAMTSAEARTRHSEAPMQVAFDRHAMNSNDILHNDVPLTGTFTMKLKRIDKSKRPRDRKQRKIKQHHGMNVIADRGERGIVGHPAGCPHRAFCGCGASVEVFGHSIRDLWLAANWYRFPRAAPAPGMVAVRRHHVFVIREVLGGNMVLAYDANSGGRQTRIHQRSLAGYTVVNPHGSRYASAQ